MEEKTAKGRKYLICFRDGQSWSKVFAQYPEEKGRIKKAYMESKDRWKVAFNERRVERAVKSLYTPFTSDIQMTGDDYKLFREDKTPIFIVNDIMYLSM